MRSFLFITTYVLSVAAVDLHQLASEAVKDDHMHHFISARQQLPHVRLSRKLMSTKRYNPSIRPVQNHSESLKVHISMSLYQLIDVNEPSQCLSMNVWMIQKWVDEFLDWDPQEFDMINYTVLPFDALWIPDTVVYNSAVMSREGNERYMNIHVESRHWEGRRGAKVSFLYPALYTIFCRLNVRYFPYDQQNCTITLGSWTNHMGSLDYASDPSVNMQSYIPNEEWDILSFTFHRHEYLYACCKEPWVIIEGSLIIRRKPLYYVVNLIVPTTIITLVAIIGFFTPASTSDERREKITMGITALLAMSILMLMVSDQMPTTSEFIPLIAWFYLANIIFITTGTFCTSAVFYIHGCHRNGILPPNIVRILFFVHICNFLCLSPPLELIRLWDELEDGITKERCKRGEKFLNDKNSQPMEETKGAYPELTKLAALSEEVITTAQEIPESSTAEEHPRKQSILSAKQNWTRVTFRLKDISRDQIEPVCKEKLPKRKRKLSTEDANKRMSLWSSAAEFIKFTSTATPQKHESAEVKTMKHCRQCTMEWEFLAIILDRIFLIFFITITILTVIGLTVTAKLAQRRYGAALDMKELIHQS